MTRLQPCPACNRHVNGGDQLCPFCQAAMPQEAVTQPGAPLGRLSRIAVLAAGATLVGGIAAAGCDDTGKTADAGAASSGGRGGGSGAAAGGAAGGGGGNDGGADQDARPPVDVPIYAAAVALLRNRS